MNQDITDSDSEQPISSKSSNTKPPGGLSSINEEKQQDQNANTGGSRTNKERDNGGKFRAYAKRVWKEASPQEHLMLVFTFVIAISTFLYMIFSGWTLYEISASSSDTHNLAIAAKSQAVIALNALEQSQRPWLSVRASISSPFEFDEYSNAGIRIRFYVKNIGHSPAFGVHIISRLGDTGSTLLNPCRRNGAKSSSYQGPTSILFPNDDVTEVDEIVMQAAEVTKAMKGEDGGMNPEVYGCVDYEFGFEAGHHQTKFAYWIDSKEIDITPSSIGKTKSIPKAALSITKDPRGAFGAD